MVYRTIPYHCIVGVYFVIVRCVSSTECFQVISLFAVDKLQLFVIIQNKATTVNLGNHCIGVDSGGTGLLITWSGKNTNIDILKVPASLSLSRALSLSLSLSLYLSLCVCVCVSVLTAIFHVDLD